MVEASKDHAISSRRRSLRDEIKALQGAGRARAKGEQEFWQPEAFVTDPKEGVGELQDALGLPEPPRIIEGIDIAHLQGGEMVGSKVCFIDGVPFKDALSPIQDQARPGEQRLSFDPGSRQPAIPRGGGEQ